MPHITVQLWSGKSEEQNSDLLMHWLRPQSQ